MNKVILELPEPAACIGSPLLPDCELEGSQEFLCGDQRLAEIKGLSYLQSRGSTEWCLLKVRIDGRIYN